MRLHALKRLTLFMLLPSVYSAARSLSDPTVIENGQAYFIQDKDQGWFQFDLESRGPVLTLTSGVEGDEFSADLCDYEIYDASFTEVESGSAFYFPSPDWLDSGSYLAHVYCADGDDRELYAAFFSNKFVNQKPISPMRGTFANPIPMTSSGTWYEIPSARSVFNVFNVNMKTDGGAIVTARRDSDRPRLNCGVYSGNGRNFFYGDGLYNETRMSTTSLTLEVSRSVDLTEGDNFFICEALDAEGELKVETPLLQDPSLNTPASARFLDLLNTTQGFLGSSSEDTSKEIPPAAREAPEELEQPKPIPSLPIFALFILSGLMALFGIRRLRAV